MPQTKRKATRAPRLRRWQIERLGCDIDYRGRLSAAEAEWLRLHELAELVRLSEADRDQAERCMLSPTARRLADATWDKLRRVEARAGELSTELDPADRLHDARTYRAALFQNGISLSSKAASSKSA